MRDPPGASASTDPRVPAHPSLPAGLAAEASLDDRWRRDCAPAQPALASWPWHPRELGSSPAAIHTAAIHAGQRIFLGNFLSSSAVSQGQSACASHGPSHSDIPSDGGRHVPGLLGQRQERFEEFQRFDRVERFAAAAAVDRPRQAGQAPATEAADVRSGSPRTNWATVAAGVRSLR